jgi:UrcA family protein
LAVDYSDLDLSRPEGRAELRHRIRHAARQVCGQDDLDLKDSPRALGFKVCYEQAVEDALATLPARAPRAGLQTFSNTARAASTTKKTPPL